MTVSPPSLCLAALLALVAGPVARAPGGDGGAKPKAALGGLDLIDALKKTPGCLGAESAATGSGKNVIFAWFASKQAVVDWYWSDPHQHAIQSLVQGELTEDHEPLAHVADDCGPILCIASITPAAAPQIKDLAMPISQIAIELYQPLPGGIAVGGRFAPDAVKVPHLNAIAR